MWKPRKILFPTKFDELSFLVVQQLLHLRDAGLEEIVFLFVVDREEVSFDIFRGLNEEYAAELEEKARARFQDWEKQLAGEGLTCSHRIELGDPAEQIIQVAREEAVDLIVAGRQRETPMEKVYLGGTSMTLIRHGDTPVMVCKPHVDDPDSDDRRSNPFERVIFATDFSEAAQRAATFLRGLNGAVQEVHVVHVLNERDLSGHSETEIRALKSEAENSLAKVAKDLDAQGWTVETHLRSGRTAKEILRARDDNDGTLIVMGTTGKHGLKELWLGSASHRCAEQSAVPVILVPAPKD